MNPGRARATLVCSSLLAVAALFFAYSNHFHNAFHFDDSHVIVNNLAIRSLHDIGSFFRDAHTFTARPENAAYRPLLTLSYALDYRAAGGLDPFPFHRTQFGLLLLLGALLVPVYKRLADLGQPGTDNRYLALCAATLFCIHTVNTETVNYLSSRSDLLSTLGVVGSFCLYLGWPRGRKTLVYLLPTIAGGLAKPLVVMLGPLLVVYLLLFEEDASLLPFGRDGFKRVGSAVLRALPALGAGIALFLVLRAMEGDALEYSNVSRTRYLISQPFVWLHYFRLFLVPTGLTADTDWVFLDSWLDPRFLVGSLFLILLFSTIVGLSVRRSLRPAAFGLAWFAIALVPTSSVFPLSEVYNEHRVFFPYVGLAFASIQLAAVLARKIASRSSRLGPRIRQACLGLALALIAAHGLATHARNRAWKDDLTLWEDVARKSPRNGRGRMNYGLALMSRGLLDDALHAFEEAHADASNYSILEINLGIVKAALGRDAEAEPHFERALALTPDSSVAHSYYARFLIAHGRGPRAIHHLRKAIELSPGDISARYMLMDLYAAIGNTAALAAQIQRTLQIAPQDPRALAHAVGPAPLAPDRKAAADHEDRAGLPFTRGDWLDAALLFRTATRLDPRSATAWSGLSLALAHMGFDTEAAACADQAHSLEPNGGDPDPEGDS